MILEIITGRRPIDKAQHYLDDIIIDWVRPIDKAQHYLDDIIIDWDTESSGGRSDSQTVGTSSGADATVDEGPTAGDEEEPLLQTVECWICQEEDSLKNLEIPCGCSGSLKANVDWTILEGTNEISEKLCAAVISTLADASATATAPERKEHDLDKKEQETKSLRVTYTSYQLRDAARDWWRSLVNYRPHDSPKITWDQFAEAFLKRFVSFGLRDCMRDEFDHLEKGSMTVVEYEASFYALCRYSYDSISIEFEQIRKFVKGLDISLQLDTSHMVMFGASFQSIMDHAKMTEGILSASQGGAKMALHFGEFRSQTYRAVQGGRLGSLVKTRRRGCYMCDEIGHIAKDCSHRMFRATPISVVRGRGSTKGARGRDSRACVGGRGATLPVGSHGQCYAIPVRFKVEASDVVISGNSLVVDWVHRSCVVTFVECETLVDLIVLDMVDFDFILGIDWLAPYHVILDCFAKIVTLSLAGMTRIAWKGALYLGPKRIISYVQARKLVERGYLSYLTHIRDISVVLSPSLDFACVVCEFMDVFPTNLSGMPPDPDIDFSIDVEPGTKPISIPPYRIAPTELQKLKDQLQGLLDKGFIRPSVSP
ncbi:hypothetical protein FXO37_21138 [Capsicum annuum]|nr:hypothetical protein FXO37_21138 [Capsicum annuum]